MIDFVSVIIPCRNEERYIEGCIQSVLSNTYPSEHVEILIVDGMSDDGTREILEKMKESYNNINVFDNIYKTTPKAFNIGIEKSRGDYVIIVGSRHIISKNYIEESIKNLKGNKRIACVGGKVINEYENIKSEAISFVMNSKFGVGMGNFRAVKKNTYVDTVGTPAYRKSIFGEVGLFDERLVRNQDDEFNFRVIKKGYKILLNTNISVKYFVRGTFLRLFKQYKQYGYWKVFVNKKHKTITTIRQLFPAAFIIFLASFIAIPFIKPFLYVYLVVLTMYFLLIMLNGIKYMLSFRMFVLVLWSAIIIHISYGLGYLRGLWDFMLWNRKPSERNMQLTR